MRTTIDAAGRVVIPKELRVRLGLTGGQEVDIQEREGRVEIEPALRAAAPVVADFLASRFPAPLLTLSEEGTRSLLRKVAAAGIAGGAIYDALVAATAQAAGAVLLSRDRRAATTYERLGTAHELLL